MNENKPTADAHAQRRRRVLRGAISAPVVLTISSGASATMASNMRCVNNQVTNPPHGNRTLAVSAASAPTSTAVRVPLYTRSGKLYIRGNDVVAMAHSSRPVSWIGNGEWWEFDEALNRRPSGSSKRTFTTAPTVTTKHAVLQFDQHGYIRSVGVNDGSTTSMIGGTCWNSFRAGPAL